MHNTLKLSLLGLVWMTAACSGADAPSTSNSIDGGIEGSTPNDAASSSNDGSTQTAPHDAATPPVDSSVCTTLTWANYAQSFFASNCITCHTHSSDFSTYAAVTASGTYGETNIVNDITTGKMPKGTSLNSTDKTDILKWFSCGAPE